MKNLKITNFVIFEEVDLNFSSINAILGETGSGKSLLIKALKQISSERVDYSLIGNFSGKATIEATFEITEGVREKLLKYDLSVDEDLVISRVMNKNMSTRIRINGEIVNLKTLKEIMDEVVEITSQLDTMKFNNDNFYYKVLDSEHQNLVKNYCSYYIDYQSLNKKMLEIKNEILNKKEEVEINKMRIKDIEPILDITNEEELYEQLERAKNQGDFIDGIKQITEISPTLQKNLDNLIAVYQTVEGLEPELQRLIDLKYELEDIDFETAKKLQDQEMEYNIEELTEKVSQLKQLKRRFNLNLAELKNYHEDLLNRNEYLDEVEILESKTAKQLKEITQQLTVEAEVLKQLRKERAKEIVLKLHEYLKQLKMTEVKVKFLFEDDQLNYWGSDRVRLVITTNDLEVYSLVSKVASGGELSRFLLAFKAVINESVEKLVVFDEIDSGVSGEVAGLMASLMKKIGKNNQLLYISHLPQVAAISKTAIVVEKETAKTVKSTARVATEAEKIAAIASLMANQGVSEEAHKLAIKLVEEMNEEE